MLTLIQVMMFIAVAFATREHWVRLAGDEPAPARFLLRWELRGLALPIAAWAFLNLGLLRAVPALVPEIAIAQSEDEAWFQLWLHWTIYGSVFIFIGAAPKTDWLPKELACDSKGFILAGPELKAKSAGAWTLDREPYLLETSVPGIFVAGDVRYNSVKRCASAVGEGSIAIQFVHQYLATL